MVGRPDRMTQRVFGITGWKNSGKTTMTARLVAEFTHRGFRVSTIKHAHHSFDIDQPGTDSHAHRMAGATEVAIVSGHRWALMHELRDETEPDLPTILARLSPCDLVLIEGYKTAPHPKIEMRRLGAADQKPLHPNDPSIAAIAADHPVPDSTVPVFLPDDIADIADLIAQQTSLGGDE